MFYNRMVHFVLENSRPNEDDNLNPTIKPLLVVRWLELMHNRLPEVVAKEFATELQTQSLHILQPNIAKNLAMLIAKAKNLDGDIEPSQLPEEDQNVNFTRNRGHPGQISFPKRPNRPTTKAEQRQATKCQLCSQANRPNNHSLVKCKYLDYITNIDSQE